MTPALDKLAWERPHVVLNYWVYSLLSRANSPIIFGYNVPYTSLIGAQIYKFWSYSPAIFESNKFLSFNFSLIR